MCDNAISIPSTGRRPRQSATPTPPVATHREVQESLLRLIETVDGCDAVVAHLSPEEQEQPGLLLALRGLLMGLHDELDRLANALHAAGVEVFAQPDEG